MTSREVDLFGQPIDELSYRQLQAFSKTHGLKAVFETGIFDDIERSWNKSSCADGKLKVCAMKCGAEFDPFAEQFK